MSTGNLKPKTLEALAKLQAAINDAIGATGTMEQGEILAKFKENAGVIRVAKSVNEGKPVITIHFLDVPEEDQKLCLGFLSQLYQDISGGDELIITPESPPIDR